MVKSCLTVKEYGLWLSNDICFMAWWSLLVSSPPVHCTFIPHQLYWSNMVWRVLTHCAVHLALPLHSICVFYLLTSLKWHLGKRFPPTGCLWAHQLPTGPSTVPLIVHWHLDWRNPWEIQNKEKITAANIGSKISIFAEKGVFYTRKFLSWLTRMMYAYIGRGRADGGRYTIPGIP